VANNKNDGYCLTCNYFAIYRNLKTGDMVSGECRRYPPQIFPASDGKAIVASNEFPQVKSNDFCGEYHKKDRHLTAMQ
jgi:hypothetical protein